MAYPTVIAWLVVTLLVVLGTLRAGRVILSLRWAPSALLALLGLIATVSLLFAFRTYWPSRPATVTITSPREGRQVGGTQLLVSGTVQPADARVILLVRSETDVQWWPQLPPTRVLRDDGVRTWSVDATLGTDDTGIGQNFMILAVASADSSLFNLLADRWADDTRARTTVPRWSLSNLVVVRRTK